MSSQEITIAFALKKILEVQKNENRMGTRLLDVRAALQAFLSSDDKSKEDIKKKLEKEIADFKRDLSWRWLPLEIELLLMDIEILDLSWPCINCLPQDWTAGSLTRTSCLYCSRQQGVVR